MAPSRDHRAGPVDPQWPHVRERSVFSSELGRRHSYCRFRRYRGTVLDDGEHLGAVPLSGGQAAYVLDSDDAVHIGPVSDPNSLLTGKLTGNFSIWGLFRR